MNRNHFSRNMFFCLVTTALYSGILPAYAADNDYEIGTWANFCQGAISHTFDDNMNTNPNGEGQKVFDDMDFHMTLFVQTGSANWNNCKESFAKGHEIGSHTTNHSSSTSSFEQSQKAIQQNVPGEKCVSVAYPDCQQNGAATLNFYLGGRNCDGQVNNKTPGNWEQISSKMFGAGAGGNPNDAGSMNSFADQAVSKKGWAVTCHHGIGNEQHSWAVTSISAMKGHIEYLDENRDKIWIETFGNVARYIKERDAATVSEKAADESSFTVEVTDDLDDEIFNYPLTIRRPLPDDWDAEKVTVTQNEEDVDATVVDDFIQFHAIPDGGDVLISSGKTATRHGMHTNKIQPTDVIRFINNTLRISTAPFAGNNITISIFNLNGKLLTQNTIREIDGPAATIALEESLNKSALVVKATNGTVSHMKKFIR